MATMWADAEAYNRFMGRWSRRLAPLLVEFAGVRDSHRVLDVGCGTGSLSRAVLELAPGSEVVGIDPAAPYVEYVSQHLNHPRARFEVGSAQELPYPDASFDRCLSQLVFNFIPDPAKAVSELRRVTRPGGVVAAAVWDYGDGMAMLRTFWDVAVALDPAAEQRREGNVPFSRKGELASLLADGGFQEVKGTALVIPMEFESFEDFWLPFLGGVGPSGSYAAGLPPERQAALRDRLRETLIGAGPDRPFSLEARAWAARGVVPAH